MKRSRSCENLCVLCVPRDSMRRMFFAPSCAKPSRMLDLQSLAVKSRAPISEGEPQNH